MPDFSHLSVKDLEQLLEDSADAAASVAYHSSLNSEIALRLHRPNPRLRSLIKTIVITDAFISIWWVSVASIPALLSIAALASGVAAGIIAILAFGWLIRTYSQERAKARACIHSYQQIKFELDISQELIKRYQSNTNQANASEGLLADAKSVDKKPQVAKLKDILIKYGAYFLGFGSMLLFTYFYGVAEILKLAGFIATAVAMTGGIGLPVAVILSIGIALACTYIYLLPSFEL